MTEHEEHNTSVLRSGDYVPFIVLSGARTGSHMLVYALKSSPSIRCFSEIFNRGVDFVAFGVEGYDNFSAADRALRDRDAVTFLHRRIFCDHPDRLRAVGFKLLYGQTRLCQGLLEELLRHTELRVMHIRRANLLRSLVSLKVAQATGVFVEQTTRRPVHQRLRAAVRHPLRAAQRVAAILSHRRASAKTSRPRLTISREELFRFVVRREMTTAHFDHVFRDQPRLGVWYEDMVDRQEDVFGEVQSFLGLEPRRLSVSLRRQNPEPLRDLIENYDELYEALKDTPVASWME